MSNRGKKIFLATTIIIPFLLYCFYYYGKMIKNAPYKFVEFEYIVLKSGENGRYTQTYNSKTQDYEYLNAQDSLVHKKVKLGKDDLLFLHRKAAELGFWDWPTNMVSDKTGKTPKYYLEYVYERKTKVIELDAAYNENPKLKDAAIQLIKTVEKTITESEARYRIGEKSK